MSNIDLKKLAEDREYWDRVAPEGATDYGASNRYFYKNVNGVWYFQSQLPGKGWVRCEFGLPLAIERFPMPPKEAQEFEWVDGLPPVGCECEVYDPKHKIWNRIKVTAHGEKVILSKWEKFDDQEFILNKSCWFRPIRTAEQHQRDELVETIAEQSSVFHIRLAEDVADAVLSRYNLEPKS